MNDKLLQMFSEEHAASCFNVAEFGSGWCSSIQNVGTNLSTYCPKNQTTSIQAAPTIKTWKLVRGCTFFIYENHVVHFLLKHFPQRSIAREKPNFALHSSYTILLAGFTHYQLAMLLFDTVPVTTKNDKGALIYVICYWRYGNWQQQTATDSRCGLECGFVTTWHLSPEC